MVSVLSDRVEEAPASTEHAVHHCAHAVAVEEGHDLLEAGSLADLLAVAEDLDSHVSRLLFVHLDVGQAGDRSAERVPGCGVQAHELLDRRGVEGRAVSHFDRSGRVSQGHLQSVLADSAHGSATDLSGQRPVSAGADQDVAADRVADRHRSGFADLGRSPEAFAVVDRAGR